MIVFASAVISVLYYVGVIQWLIRNIGWMMSVTMGTTAVESFNAAGNIFLGFVRIYCILSERERERERDFTQIST